MARKIIGLSCFYHDSAVAAIEGGAIRFAIQEERLSRVKHDSRFPIMAIAKTLEVCKWSVNEIDTIVFYENPVLKLNRLYNQVISDWPRSWKLFSEHVPQFYAYKYPIEQIIRDKLRYNGTVRCAQHHLSHAASAFYTSPFESALVLTIDGVGEYDTTALFSGEGNIIKPIRSIHFPDSLGLLYSVFTQYLGFEVNEGEYKVMGLAPYGKPRFTDRILGRMIKLNGDGSFEVNTRYFDFSNRDRHYRDAFADEIGVPPRTSKDPMLKDHEDLAASIQQVLEMAVINILKVALDEFPNKNVCMAGGVALNCTANSRIAREFGVKMFIQPAAGDAGGALGAALLEAIKDVGDSSYRFPFTPYLGVDYRNAIEVTLRLNGLHVNRVENIEAEIAKQLAKQNVVAILSGRDEWGPRALGDRSILADPRDPKMKDHLNAKIKFREEFRPFAPVVMEEYYAEYFETLGMDNSPYMLFTHRALRPEQIPAVVHVDGTSRAQTVSEAQNPYMYAILSEFKRLTGVPVLINTSFNLKGEPIVSGPSDALKTFFASGIDSLALEDYLVEKSPR